MRPRAHSYLAIDKIVSAARDSGCDALHPGYGFLDENAGFIQAALDAVLTFIGPAQTRRVLGLALSACLNAPVAETGYGVFRM